MDQRVEISKKNFTGIIVIGWTMSKGLCQSFENKHKYTNILLLFDFSSLDYTQYICRR